MNPFRAAVLGAGQAVRTMVGPRGNARVQDVTLPIADLDAAFDGYTIVGLSDFHHAPGTGLSWLEFAVHSANEVSPDAVVLLGDYGESFRKARAESRPWYLDSMAEMTPVLARLRARDGVFAVLGNHDYYAGARDVAQWLEALNSHLLVNRCHCITRDRATLRIAGLDDLREGRPDRTAGCDVTSNDPTVLLSHNPDGILHVDPQLRIDVVLAGHTHGGQVVVPGIGAMITMARTCGRTTASGWVPNARAPLYVTRGLGEQRPLPMRVNCPAEMFVLRLRRGSQQPA